MNGFRDESHNPNSYLARIQRIFYDLKTKENIDLTKEPWKSMTGNEIFRTMKLDYPLADFMELVDIKKAGKFIIIHYNEDAVFNQDVVLQRYLNEARGLVLDLDKEQPVIVPFKKFRNLNETEEYSLSNIENIIKNNSGFEISEKLDGSMISMSMYENEIIVATGKNLDPKISLQIDLAKKYLNSDIKDMIKANPGQTFIFELLDRHDPHTVSYKGKDFGLHLIGIRDNKTGREKSYEDVHKIADKYKIKTTDILYSIHGEFGDNPKQKLKIFHETLDSLSKPQKELKEGYVVNVDGFRFKMKYDDYLKRSRTLPGNSICPRYVLQHIADNTIDDFYSHVPTNRQDIVKEIIDNVRQYKSLKDEETTEYYEDAISHSTDKKSFMLYTESFPADIKANVRNKYNHTEPELSTRYILSKAGKVQNYQEIEDFLELHSKITKQRF